MFFTIDVQIKEIKKVILKVVNGYIPGKYRVKQNLKFKPNLKNKI